MRKVLVLMAVLLGMAPSFWTVAYACGDKFLVVGRSARFNQVYAAIYPAAILLYAHAERGAPTAVLNLQFQNNLTRAGHRLQVVNDEWQLEQTLRTGNFDLVLADVSDVESTKAKAEQSASKPTVLPVMYKPTKAEAEAVRTRFQCELKSSDRAVRYLAVIDDQMEVRVKLRGSRKTP
jgi:hypothetical protein